MLSSVHAMLCADAGRVFESLTGQKLPKHRPVFDPAFFDLQTGEGSLLERYLASMEARDWSAVPYWAGQLGCPFHLAQGLYEAPWHANFDTHLECLRRDLPFIYDPLARFQELSKAQLVLFLRRTMTESLLQVTEAYQYGNGFPNLRGKFVQEWYQRCATWILSSWLFLFESSGGGTGAVAVLRSEPAPTLP